MRRPIAIATEISLLLGGLTVVAVAVTYPLIRHLTTHLPNDLGDPVLVAWILAWDAEAFRHGLSQIFNAPSFFPYLHTLMYSEHLIGIAVFTAPLQWLTMNPVLVYNIAFIASFVQAGAGMYVLARSLSGRRDAALLAALAYAFTPYRVAQFAHLQWLMTGWLPLSVWALHRYFSTGALAFLLASAAAYVLQSMTGSYFAYYALLPLAAVAIAELWRIRPPSLRTLWHLALVGSLCALAFAPIVGAYYAARQDRDFRRPVSEIAALSADLGDYFRGHNHVALWQYARPGTGEHELFPGAIVLVLAGVALCAPRGAPTSRIRLYAVIAAIALVFSLGPLPSAWGHQMPVRGPYQILLNIIPGLDGLRAVARLAVIVVLGLCVLVAYGSGQVLDRVPDRRRSIVTAALAIGLIAEGWAAPILTEWFDPLANADDRGAYAFLRQAGREGAVLELPMSLANDSRERRYQYLTFWHDHRIVNGSSSYTPALTQLLGNEEQSPFTGVSQIAAGITLVRNVGVRYVLVHGAAFETRAAEDDLLRELRRDDHLVIGEQGFGRTRLFTLAEAPPLPSDLAGWKPIPSSAIRARASHSADRLPLLFDRDRDTRWLTGKRQTGNEWIELELDRPRSVEAVRMQTAERSFGDYPRELVIEAVEAGRGRTLFHGSVLPAFGRGFVINQSYPDIVIPLPANHAQMIRLRQVASTNQLFWSIHELELLER